MINNEELADEIIRRLNDLIKDEHVRKDISLLLRTRVEVSEETSYHPTIQVMVDDTDKSKHIYKLGFLGLLNGLVGVINGGKYDRWGYILAEFDHVDGEVIRFYRTEEYSDD